MGAPRVPFPSIAFRQNICCVAWWAEVLSSWLFPNRNRSPCRDVTLPETLLWGTFPFRQNIFHEARQAGSGGRKCFPRGNLPFWQNICHGGTSCGCVGGRWPVPVCPIWEHPPHRDASRVPGGPACVAGVLLETVVQFSYKSLRQICTRHGSKASIQDGKIGKLKNLIKNFPSLICFCPTQPCRLHRLTVQSVSLTDTGPSSFAAATICTG